MLNFRFCRTAPLQPEVRMTHSILPALLVLLLTGSPFAQTKADPPKAPPTASPATSADSASVLPVKRVVLYKNGVGYFEHSARVHGTQDLSIDFTTAQLNDVLKSLTAVDLGDGRVSSVRYNSIAPLDERLKSLRLPFGEQVTQAEYLTALRGARVEVHSGSATATGRLLSVEKIRKQRARDDFEDVTTFSIVSDAGEMRNFDLGSATSVRIAERELTAEVGRYLSLIGSSRARDVRRMSFTAAGSGDRDIFVSYISEVPVWKSTYRILFPEKPNEKPLLQGWAIVDNTIGEDWKDVQLSLVAGAPQSFMQDISQPFYVRRPVVPLARVGHAYAAVARGDARTVCQVAGAALPRGFARHHQPLRHRERSFGSGCQWRASDRSQRRDGRLASDYERCPGPLPLQRYSGGKFRSFRECHQAFNDSTLRISTLASVATTRSTPR